jgi:hypothetical protein
MKKKRATAAERQPTAEKEKPLFRRRIIYTLNC